MDLETAIERAFEDRVEYSVQEGEYALGGDKSVCVEPENTDTKSFVGDIRDALLGTGDTFTVKIYEGNTVIESQEVETVREAKDWLDRLREVPRAD